MNTILTFLGSTAFRWLFGEIFGVLKASQERKAELEAIKLQFEHDKQRAEWQRQAAAEQAAAGIKVIEAQAVARTSELAGQAFNIALEGINEASRRPDWIGKFNAFIRPELAQVSIILLVANSIWPTHVTISAMLGEIIAGVLGLFVGGRISSTGR